MTKSQNGLDLVLGTAQWGWTLPAEEAFRLLDAWLGAGFSEIDAATNYPINKIAADFRKSEHILQEYIRAHGLHDALSITMKIGALDNMRSPDINLSPSFIRMMAEEYRRLLGDNLRGIMFHWDNRNEPAALAESLDALIAVCAEFELQPGLSGIAHPEAYAGVLHDSDARFDIELKHNVLVSDVVKYKPLRTCARRFIAYGINAGGLRLDGQYHAGIAYLSKGGRAEQHAPILCSLRQKLPEWNTAFVRPPIMSMNHLGLIHAAGHPDINGVILGVSSTTQLAETLDFVRNLDVFDYTDIQTELNKGRMQ